MRFVATFLLLLLFLLVGCVSQPLPLIKAFDGCPHYPLIVIPVSPSLSLRHVAGPPCDFYSTARPHIGIEGPPTYSTYELLDANRAKIFTAPSMLSDPKYHGEFQNYYRKNDQITVLTSTSKNTIVIVEDRSSAGPNRAFILLRHMPGSSWTWSQIDVPLLWMGPENPADRNYAEIVGLSDMRIWFYSVGRTRPNYSQTNYTKGRTWSRSLDVTKKSALQ